MMENQEIAFTILDLLFLYGNPIASETFFDDNSELTVEESPHNQVDKE